jgi:hypothetical protein
MIWFDKKKQHLIQTAIMYSNCLPGQQKQSAPLGPSVKWANSQNIIHKNNI